MKTLKERLVFKQNACMRHQTPRRGFACRILVPPLQLWRWTTRKFAGNAGLSKRLCLTKVHSLHIFCAFPHSHSAMQLTMRTVISDYYACDMLLRLLQRQQWKRVTVFYESDLFGNGLKNEFEKQRTQYHKYIPSTRVRITKCYKNKSNQSLGQQLKSTSKRPLFTCTHFNLTTHERISLKLLAVALTRVEPSSVTTNPQNDNEFAFQ